MVEGEHNSLRFRCQMVNSWFCLHGEAAGGGDDDLEGGFADNYGGVE